MKILFTHRYFWPDSPPYAIMLNALTKNMANSGHQVHVFATMPSYRRDEVANTPRQEETDGIKISRCRVIGHEKRHFVLRALNVAIYCISLFFHILRTRPQVVTASTFPPVFAGWTASLAAKIIRAKFIYHMQDIHPEVSKYIGGRMGRGIIFHLFRALDNQTLRRCSAIVVLSEDMADTLCARDLERLPIRIINNFSVNVEQDSDARPATTLVKPAGRRQVIFAGNLGRFQYLPALAEGVARLFPRHPDLDLLFLGDGEALSALKARWGENPQVIFRPFLPFAEAKPVIMESDVGLVSLAPNIYRVSFPSKILTYVELGLPILAMVEPSSKLSGEINDYGIGGVPGSTDPDDIAAALEAILEAPDHSQALAAYTKTTAAPAAAFARWRSLLDELSTPPKLPL